MVGNLSLFLGAISYTKSVDNHLNLRTSSFGNTAAAAAAE